jgi:tRNA threonylcarbamoyladenosine modification (KEOPS) complex  Pcc1 subunit
MSPEEAVWTATVRVTASGPHLASMLERSLRPEAEREVPRTRATLSRPSPETVELTISARDPGAMRAALNTYLGWVHLSLAAVRSGTAPAPAGPTRAE